MRINSVRVQTFRSLRDTQIDFTQLTAQTGSNGAGNFLFLRSLNLLLGGQGRE